MQNVQNAEIQHRVINLVELYRTKVGKESQIAKEAKEDHDYWDQLNLDMAIEAHEAGLPSFSGVYGEGPHTEEWIKHLMINEQLLGHFYSVVAGEHAEKDVLNQLLPDCYDKTIFTVEEENFLKLHFKEMVNYIISTPNDESLELVNIYDNKDICLIPNEVLDLIASRISIPVDATIFDPFAGFAQFANVYHGRKFLFEDSYEVFNRRWNAFCDAANDLEKVENIGWQKAWMKIAVFANKVDAEIIDDGIMPENYDAVLSFLPQIPIIEENETFANISKIEGMTVASKITSAYHHLKDGGVMGLLIPRSQLFENEKRTSQFKAFTDMIIMEGALIEIVQLPSVMSSHSDFCLLVVKKNQCDTTTLIDARFASKRSPKKNCPKAFDIFDMESFNSMMQNNGKEVITGLRKIVQLPMQELNPVLLLPQVYVVEKPYDVEHPLPFSKLGELATTRIRDLQFNLPEDTPWVELKDLSLSFKGNLDITSLKKADCPNNPPYVKDSKDYTFSPAGKFVDDPWAQMYSKKGIHVYDYRSCTYLDGKKETVLFWPTDKGVGTAIVQTSDRPIAVGKGIKVFVPKEGIDALTVVATLRIPVVFRQLKAYEIFGLAKHLDDILVPTDKRVIVDELSHMNKEEAATTKLKEGFEAAQKKHIMKLEDYQHAMRKHIREISSSVRRMERFINGMESSEEIKVFLHERLEVIKTHRLYLSDDIERLNEENTYGKAVPFDIDHCLKGFIDYFGSNAYPIAYSNEVSKMELKQYVESHRKELNDMNEVDRSKTINRINVEKSFVYVDISEYNFCKVVRNILENARMHGFSTNISRNDYKIEIILTWNSERKMYQIDFRNNGDPLPDGLSKESYGENRKYAGKTGGTGIGGYEVADTVKHYKGDYAISQDGDWVVVSVYLPKSKSYEEGV